MEPNRRAFFKRIHYRRFRYPNGAEKKFGKHPTQKPIALIERIIMASTNVGDLVLDPFVNLGRRFVGTELEPEFIDLSIERLGDALFKRATTCTI